MVNVLKDVLLVLLLIVWLQLLIPRCRSWVSCAVQHVALPVAMSSSLSSLHSLPFDAGGDRDNWQTFSCWLDLQLRWQEVLSMRHRRRYRRRCSWHGFFQVIGVYSGNRLQHLQQQYRWKQIWMANFVHITSPTLSSGVCMGRAEHLSRRPYMSMASFYYYLIL